MQTERVVLQVFSRCAYPGQVKTRLQAWLGVDGVLSLHQQLVTHTLQQLLVPSLFPAELWLAPDTDDPWMQRLAQHYGLSVYAQQGCDLGARMALAAQQAFRTADAVIQVGTDCPVLSVDRLRQVMVELSKGRQVVIIPAEDGGYVLIAMRQFDAAIFAGIEWGSERVLQQTEQQLCRLDLSYTLLPPLWDVDRPQDVARWCKLAGRATSPVCASFADVPDPA